ASGRLVRGGEVARAPIGRPALEPCVRGLARRRRRRARGSLGEGERGRLRGQLPRLRLVDVRREVVRLAALAVRQADPDVEVIAVAIDMARARASATLARAR